MSFSKVRDLVMSLEGDFKKFYENGNKAAGTRVRKGMLDMKKLAQEIRNEVQGKKNKDAKKAAAKKPAAKTAKKK